MGNSTSSCFKIITCSADSTQVDNELSRPESKQSSDKRRWSFGKRSAKHQVPSNSVISEPQFVGYDKGNLETTADTFQSVKNSSVPEKTLVERACLPAPSPSVITNPEKPQSGVKLNEIEPLPSSVLNPEFPSGLNQTDNAATFSSPAVNSEVTGVPDTVEVTTAIDTNFQENIAIVIQSAARRFLAKRELKKIKHVAKLQAAVRGYLVRRQAIGTLRCVHAIVKMQGLVRSHLARQCQSLENCSGQEKDDQKASRDSNLKSNNTNSITEKLLLNAFACQLLESAPKTKTIHISCDPMRHDSTWQWLERWMAVTSSEIREQKELNSQENVTSIYEKLGVVHDSDSSHLSGPKFSPRVSPNAEGEQYSEIHNFVKFESQTSEVVSDQCFSSLAKDDREHTKSEHDLGSKENNFTETAGGKETSNTASETVQYPNKTGFVSGNLKDTTKSDASDSAEAEVKKFDVGSRKVRNPAFAAVQAKFEELSLASKATKSTSYSSRDSTVESKPYKSQNAQVISVTNSKDVSSAVMQNPVIQVAHSECGTEISISSTLDSPERSEADGGEEIVLEIGAPREGNHNANNGATHSFNLANMKAEVEQPSAASDDSKGKVAEEEDDDNTANSIFPVESVNVEEQPAETTALGASEQDKNLKAHAYSEATQQAKTSKEQHDINSRKLKSISKSSPSKVKKDTGEKNSNENLPKDAKNVNRRISFGVAKSDAFDHEPRRSTSNTLPSYMQATESARAKAHVSSSLKSSPDSHDKENYVKKRHSLPIAEEKQGSSPRVQKTISQTPPSNKGNNTPSPHSSAERRWQR